MKFLCENFKLMIYGSSFVTFRCGRAEGGRL